ncbi:hypothetical protein C8R46DRAFT_1351132 [Mycena filopes]|nr:hypothetical protein C8R46DRAFT_1351132 [Mycena filopes]
MSLPSTTRQYSFPQLGSYNNLVLEDVPLAAPRPNEVLVKTHAVSLQFRDLLVASGAYAGSQSLHSVTDPAELTSTEVCLPWSTSASVTATHPGLPFSTQGGRLGLHLVPSAHYRRLVPTAMYIALLPVIIKFIKVGDPDSPGQCGKPLQTFSTRISLLPSPSEPP